MRRRLPNRLRFLEEQKAQGESRALEKFQTRDWKAGDIYAPHDLSPAEMKKWGKRKSPSRDAFDALNLNPLDLYKVCAGEFSFCSCIWNGHTVLLTLLLPQYQKGPFLRNDD